MKYLLIFFLPFAALGQSTNLWVGQSLAIGSALTTTIYSGGGVYTNVTGGLVAWWQFEESSGTTSYDSSGNSYTATVNLSTVDYVPGIIGTNAIQFVSNYETTPSIDASSWSEMTISFWIKTTSTNLNSIVLQWGSAFVKYAWSGQSFYDVRWSFTGSSSTGATVGQDIDDGSWHYIVCTWDGTNSKIYLDGILKDTKAATGTAPNAIVSLGNGSSGFLLKGAVDDMRIYNRVLSVGEINDLYNWRP